MQCGVVNFKAVGTKAALIHQRLADGRRRVWVNREGLHSPSHDKKQQIDGLPRAAQLIWVCAAEVAEEKTCAQKKWAVRVTPMEGRQ